MEPSLKAILEGYRGHVEVIPQALKAEVLLFFHGANVLGCLGKYKGEIAIEYLGLDSIRYTSQGHSILEE
jgi:hypothetical protein